MAVNNIIKDFCDDVYSSIIGNKEIIICATYDNGNITQNKKNKPTGIELDLCEDLLILNLLDGDMTFNINEYEFKTIFEETKIYIFNNKKYEESMCMFSFT